MMYSLGSIEGQAAIEQAIDQRLQSEQFPIELNKTDLKMFMKFLREQVLVEQDNKEMEEWAVNWYTGVAGTLGVELV